MLWTNVKYYTQIPFINLSRRAKSIFTLRLICLFVALISATIILGGNASTLPVLNLNCDHANLATGMFDALEDSFSDENNFLTTSEIKILVEYIENHIADTPELIQTGLFDWCYTVYNHDELDPDSSDFGSNDPDMFKEKPDITNSTVTCSPRVRGYGFDYRGELSDIGLNIILAYAYTANFHGDQSDLSTIVYEPDTSYLEMLESRKHSIAQFIMILIITITLEIIMIISTFVYYSLRGNEMDDAQISILFKNFFAILSAIDLILSYVGFAIIILQMENFQRDITHELSSYGIKLHYGSKFITISIFWLISSTIIFIAWAGPVWFNRSMKKKEPIMDQLSLAMHDYASDSDDQDDYDVEQSYDHNDDEYDYDYDYNSYDKYEDENSSILNKKRDTFNIYPGNQQRQASSSFEDDKSDLNDLKSSKTGKSHKTTKTGDLTTRSISSTDSNSDSTLDERDKHQNNPFTNKFASEADLNPLRKQNLFQNNAFMRSEHLFGKRRPPTNDNIILDNNDLIPMSPIIIDNSNDKQGIITPNIKYNENVKETAS